MNNYIHLSHNIIGELMYIFNNFIIYSVLGYILEIIISLIFNHNPSSGFMYGPYTPVYGIGICLIFSLFDKYKKIKPEFKKILLMFLSSFLILTFLELIGGELLKLLYHIKLWDYTELPLNLGKYVSIEISTIWSIGTILIHLYLKPKTDKLAKKIPNWITITILFIMIIDFIITNINLLKI